MFETIESKPSLVGAYVAQSLVVPVAVGALSLPAVLLYDRFVRSAASASAATVWDEAGVTVFLVFGFLVGRFLAARIESCLPTGLWVWLPPAVISVLDFLGDWFNPSEHAEAFAMHFNSVGGHEGMIRVLGTDPTLSFIGYSFGLYLAVRSSRRAAAIGAVPRVIDCTASSFLRRAGSRGDRG